MTAGASTFPGGQHLSHAGVCLLNDRVAPGPHFAPSLILCEKPKRARIVATAEGRKPQ